MDLFDKFDEIQVIVAYKLDGKNISEIPTAKKMITTGPKREQTIKR